AKLAGTGTGDFIALGALLDRGADLDRAVASSGILRGIDAYSGPMLGFLTHRLLLQVGSTAAQRLLASLRPHLVDSFGSRADALADALSLELERAGEDIRADVRKTHETRIAEMERQRSRPQTATIPFVELTDSEVEEVRREVRRFAEGLRGGARVRARRRTRHGRIDVHRTLRLAVRTGGVPMQLAREERPRDRPKIVLLCDVSESVRAVACFLLEFTYAVQDLFHKARSFVFVSDLVETTPLFARKPVRAAIALAWQGGIAGLGDNSNYGRVLRTFEAEYARELDGRTTVVVLGDGRTNYHDAAPDVLDRIRDRSRALLWLCPEPRSQWGQGDSAMGAYGPKCTAVYEVRCAADLELAAHAIVARG
ncbi:MAG: VWA domain-containing protein, partial [Myxococcota bacterium]|nr:VWA domain-containing protein [Myxococcota bacterium]